MPLTDTHNSYDRFSERCFRDMELFIHRCISEAKLGVDPIVFSHNTLQSVTVVRRMRDSIRAFVNSTWTSPYFTKQDCLDTFAWLKAGGIYTLSWKNHKTRVVCGTYKTMRSPEALGQLSASLETDEYIFEWRDQETVRAVLLLKNLNHITNQVKVMGELDPETLESEYPNIAVIEEESNLYIIT